MKLTNKSHKNRNRNLWLGSIGLLALLILPAAHAQAKIYFGTLSPILVLPETCNTNEAVVGLRDNNHLICSPITATSNVSETDPIYSADKLAHGDYWTLGSGEPAWSSNYSIFVGLINNASYLSTYNSTYDAKVSDNSSWSQAIANTLYASISVTGNEPAWSGNYSIFTGLINNASYLACYNSTYDALLNIVNDQPAINSLSIGTLAQVLGNTKATAIGNNATASGNEATSLGYGAYASDNGATAIGGGAYALDYGTAIGDQASAFASGGIALGYAVQATGDNSTAIGYGIENSISQTIAFGIGNIFLSLKSGAADFFANNITTTGIVNSSFYYGNLSTAIFPTSACTGSDKVTSILSNGKVTCGTDLNMAGIMQIPFVQTDIDYTTRNSTVWYGTGANINQTIFANKFNFTLTANTNYTLDCLLFVGANVTTTGVQFNLTLIKKPYLFVTAYDHPTTAALAAYVTCTGIMYNCNDASITSVAYPATLPVTIKSRLNTNTSDSLTLYFKSEITYTPAIIAAGSYCRLTNENQYNS